MMIPRSRRCSGRWRPGATSRPAWLAAAAAHKRLDPPLLMALDEVTTVCPVDLPVMLSATRPARAC